MNPYTDADRRRRGRLPWRPVGLGAVAAAAVVGFAIRPHLFWFLDGGDLAVGLEGAVFRVAAVAAAIGSLQAYGLLVRGPDAAVLAPHPIRPTALLEAMGLRALRDGAWVPASASAAMLPVVAAEDGIALWALGAIAACLSWLSGLALGAAAALGGVWASRSPAMARVLEALRGDNPPMQAALIYAPGAAMLAAGASAAVAAAGAGAVASGWVMGQLAVLAPLVAAFAGAGIAVRLADRHLVRVSSVLAEVDGLWTAREAQERGGAAAGAPSRVYLQGLATPGGELERALRQGWRAARTGPMLAFGAGLVAVLGGWSDAARAVAWGAGGALVAASVGPRLAAGDPDWLDRALGVDPRRVSLARSTAAFLYAQGAALPAALVLAVHHRDGGAAIAVQGTALVGAAASALAAGRWRAAGAWAYGPVALLLWAGALGVVQ